MHHSPGMGDPVILVHGNGSTQETWSGVVAPMSRHYRCISYDLRGHGASRQPLGDPTIDVLVEDLERLRAELALTSFRLVGHSLGAFIAAAYAVRHPARVEALALLAAPAYRTEADREAGRQLIERLEREGVARVMSTLVESWYRPEFLAGHPKALEERLKQIATIPDDVFIRTYNLYIRTEIGPLLPAIGVPCLVMTGEHARGCGSAVAKGIVGRLAKPSLVVFEGLRNGILTEIPERVAEELVRFFRAH